MGLIIFRQFPDIQHKTNVPIKNQKSLKTKASSIARAVTPPSSNEINIPVQINAWPSSCIYKNNLLKMCLQNLNSSGKCEETKQHEGISRNRPSEQRRPSRTITRVQRKNFIHHLCLRKMLTLLLQMSFFILFYLLLTP